MDDRGMATHHRDVETKLEPPEGAELPDLKAMPRVAAEAGDVVLARVRAQHGALVAQDVLARLLDGEHAFSSGLLAGSERARALAAESELGPAWARARAKRRRRWLE